MSLVSTKALKLFKIYNDYHTIQAKVSEKFLQKYK